MLPVQVGFGVTALVPAALRIALIALAGWLTVVWFCGAVYVAVSYVAAAPHVPARPLGRVLRSVLVESWLVLWSQPLLPLFQITGKRMSTGGGTVPVVLVHGYFQNRVDFLYLASRLRRAGCGPIVACNFFWPQPLESSSATVARFVDRVLRETGAPAVDIVTHSTGGIFALDLLEQRPEVIRRAALLALPGRGVVWRGPVVGASGSQLRANSRFLATRSNEVRADVPVLSVYSLHDNMVHPAATSELTGPAVTNVQVEDLGHLSILFDRAVADEVCDFLLA